MKFYFLLGTLVMIQGCQTGPEPPVDLVPKEKMVGLLIDIHILESKVNKLRVKSDSAKAIYNTFEAKIFLDHHIEKEVYQKSLQYYLVEAKKLEKIYQIVVDSLNLRQKRATLEVQKNKDAETNKKELKIQSKQPILGDIKKDSIP